MYLTRFSVCGFRSLALVENIPVSSPTILAGRNDGGKSAVLTALAFLLGEHRLTDEDRTYVQLEGAAGGRCSPTWVEGVFALDAGEQAVTALPQTARIRRIAEEGQTARWEYFGSRPADSRLHDVGRMLKGELAELAAEFSLTPAGSLKEDLVQALNAYAATAPQVEQWQPLAKELQERLPRLLSFGGRDESPDAAVRTALNSCYETYLEDETLQGRVREIEAEVTQRLEKEADSLCQHIRRHCGEFVGVQVKPEVSFKGGFKRAPLEVSKADGEPVDLTRSGQGSNRRIALAVWEWTSNLLESSELTAGERGGQEPTQTIVVYDEPDTHLDYRHQRTVMDIIRKQCTLPHVSVVVATHSMNLIDGVDIADVVHLRLSESGRTIVERLADESHDGVDFHLGQIAAAVGLRNSVLLHERCFLAVEGPTEQQCLPLLFRLSQGLSLQAAGIALWACGNNEGALHLAGYLVKNRRTVMLMVDADSRTNKHFKTERLIRTGLDLATQVSYVGEADGFNELEELFTDAQWAAAANTHWPRPTGSDWTTGHFAAHRGGKFSGAVLTMIKEQAAQTSPDGKDDMLYALVTTLAKAEDVPSQLRNAFRSIQDLAS
ncbi:ATP-dependent endonuclease [Streptomyces sp. NPDC060188]|uniref:ATP-dependent nuclease n=1 Tax=Streptomyces sp. NPDC060188 TaxID=3347068 RepID=UPI00364E1914